MSGREKQSDLILRALREAGDHGITQKDMMMRGVMRLASRIHDLREEGHNIVSERKTVGDATIAVYKIIEEEQGRLFDIRPEETPQERVAAYY